MLMFNRILLMCGAPQYKITLMGSDASLDKYTARGGDTIILTCSPPAYRYVEITTSPTLSLVSLGSNRYSFTMPDENVTIEVKYVESSSHAITIYYGSNGVVQSNKTTAKWGETITLTISPNSGYALSSIYSNDVTLYGSGNSRTFTMPDKNVTINASFYEIPPETGYVKAQLTIGTRDNSQFGYYANSHGSLNPNYNYTVLQVAALFGYFVDCTRPFYYNNTKYFDGNFNDDPGDKAKNLYNVWSKMVGQTVTVWLAPQ